MNHQLITEMLGGKERYGKGITPNPFERMESEWQRRKTFASERAVITEKIISIFEPRFITPPPTSEFIEALITMTEAKKVLEIGTCTGFTAYHMLRALWGKPGVYCVTIDARPAHHAEFFNELNQLHETPIVEHVEGWTPDILRDERVTRNAPYNVVFLDSDHSLEHTQKELEAVWPLTRPGTILLMHDLPAWQHSVNHTKPPVRVLMEQMAAEGSLIRGFVLPTSEQLDCLDAYGPGYPQELNPHLGIFIRT